jgi:KaiC/GvpD/RAD55 family RecA-like ATPase
MRKNTSSKASRSSKATALRGHAEQSSARKPTKSSHRLIKKPNSKLQSLRRTPPKPIKKVIKTTKKIIKPLQQKVKRKIASTKSNLDIHKTTKNILDKTQKPTNGKMDLQAVKRQIETELKGGHIEKHEAQVLETRAPAAHAVAKGATTEGIQEQPKAIDSKKFIQTGIPGFDDLFDVGVPKGSAVIMAGGAGSGKTIMCLQTLMYHCSQGKKCFYMSFEESEDRLLQHMEEFGWPAKKYVKKGLLRVKRYSPFEITRSVDAMLAKEKGELLIDLDPVIIPKGYKPDFIALDSLTAIASAFVSKQDTYRIYIEQLFRFLERMGTTSFLITETKQIPEIFSQTGVEEFLADGVIVLYNFKVGDVREKAIEVLKMRGASHKRKIVAMQITSQGVVVYPDQEVFAGQE